MTRAGKSAALIIDRAMVRLLGWDDETELVVQVVEGELIVSKA